MSAAPSRSRPSRSAPARGPIALAQCESLRGLMARAGALTDLDHALRGRLPPTLAEQVRLGNVRDGRIVFVASSAAWAARLRMEQATLLRLARTLGVDARGVTIRIAPLPAAPPEPAAGPALSAAAARHLRAAAAASRDPQLRAQLLAMASLATS